MQVNVLSIGPFRYVTYKSFTTNWIRTYNILNKRVTIILRISSIGVPQDASYSGQPFPIIPH